MTRSRLLWLLIFVTLIDPNSPRRADAQGSEEMARRHYDLGLRFVQSQKYSEALKDFQTVVDSYPTSNLADDALLEIAKYQINIARDHGLAQETVEVLLKKYPSGNAAAMAYVIAGQIALAKGHSANHIDTAIASFERVVGLFPGSNAVPAAIYYAGEALRVGRRNTDATERYRQVAEQYPRSPWATKAMLASALTLTVAGNPQAAMQVLQRVRATAPDSAEATVALHWNTILYRLYLRAPAHPAYEFVAAPFAQRRVRDVVALAVDSSDNVFLADKATVSVFKPGGDLIRQFPALDPSALFIDWDGATPVVVREGSVVREKGAPTTFVVPAAPGRQGRRIENMYACVTTSKGERLVADRDTKTIVRFAADGTYVGQFATAEVSRMAVNSLDDVAVLDRESKTVTVFDREGKNLGRVATRGSGYELPNPVDVAYDPLGHLYILDRERGALLVFNAQLKLMTTFTIPERSPGSFHRAVALAVDSAARLYIVDERAERVQMYQ